MEQAPRILQCIANNRCQLKHLSQSIKPIFTILKIGPSFRIEKHVVNQPIFHKNCKLIDYTFLVQCSYELEKDEK